MKFGSGTEMLSGSPLSMCKHSLGKACCDREPLDLTNRTFLDNGKKEELRAQRESFVFHVVSLSLVFSLGLVRGPAVMSQGCSIHQQTSSIQLGKSK